MTEKKILQLIAEGYYHSCFMDRYIKIENPDNNHPWDDPFIVWDTWYGKEIE